jgi:isoamylase
MITAGDEIGRTQQGDNDAYCQDSEISWIEWEHAARQLPAFSCLLIDFCKQHPIFRRRRWFQGRAIRRTERDDIGWLRPDGAEMSDEDWRAGFAKSLGMFPNGKAIPGPDLWGRRIVDDSVHLIFNLHFEPVEFTLSPSKWGKTWRRVITTTSFLQTPDSSVQNAGAKTVIQPRSILVMCHAE